MQRSIVDAVRNIEISWDEVSSATEYGLFRDGLLVQELAGTSLTFVVTEDDVPPDGTWFYSLTAMNACGVSAVGTGRELTITALPSTPASPAVTPNPFPCSTESLTFSWAGVSGATRYQVFLNGETVGDEVTGTSAIIPAYPGSYYLKAGNDCGWSDAGADVAVNGEDPPSAPTAPEF